MCKSDPPCKTDSRVNLTLCAIWSLRAILCPRAVLSLCNLVHSCNFVHSCNLVPSCIFVIVQFRPCPNIYISMFFFIFPDLPDFQLILLIFVILIIFRKNIIIIIRVSFCILYTWWFIYIFPSLYLNDKLVNCSISVSFMNKSCLVRFVFTSINAT